MLFQDFHNPFWMSWVSFIIYCCKLLIKCCCLLGMNQMLEAVYFQSKEFCWSKNKTKKDWKLCVNWSPAHLHITADNFMDCFLYAVVGLLEGFLYMCLLHKFQDIYDLIVRKPFCKDLLSFILSKLLTEWLQKCRKTLAIICLINTLTKPMDQSEIEAITLSQYQACKYMCKQVAIAFVFLVLIA